MIFVVYTCAQQAVPPPDIFRTGFAGGGTYSCPANTNYTFLSSPHWYSDLTVTSFSFVADPVLVDTFRVSIGVPYVPQNQIWIVLLQRQGQNVDLFGSTEYAVGNCDWPAKCVMDDFYALFQSKKRTSSFYGTGLLQQSANQYPFNAEENPTANWTLGATCDTLYWNMTINLTTLLKCTTATPVGMAISITNQSTNNAYITGVVVATSIGFYYDVSSNTLTAVQEPFYLPYSINITGGVTVVNSAIDVITISTVAAVVNPAGAILVCLSGYGTHTTSSAAQVLAEANQMQSSWITSPVVVNYTNITQGYVHAFTSCVTGSCTNGAMNCAGTIVMRFGLWDYTVPTSPARITPVTGLYTMSVSVVQQEAGAALSAQWTLLCTLYTISSTTGLAVTPSVLRDGDRVYVNFTSAGIATGIPMQNFITVTNAVYLCLSDVPGVQPVVNSSAASGCLGQRNYITLVSNSMIVNFGASQLYYSPTVLPATVGFTGGMSFLARTALFSQRSLSVIVTSSSVQYIHIVATTTYNGGTKRSETIVQRDINLDPYTSPYSAPRLMQMNLLMTSATISATPTPTATPDFPTPRVGALVGSQVFFVAFGSVTGAVLLVWICVCFFIMMRKRKTYQIDESIMIDLDRTD